MQPAQQAAGAGGGSALQTLQQLSYSASHPDDIWTPPPVWAAQPNEKTNISAKIFLSIRFSFRLNIIYPIGGVNLRVRRLTRRGREGWG